jgi:hypothetical protein
MIIWITATPRTGKDNLQEIGIKSSTISTNSVKMKVIIRVAMTKNYVIG